MRTVTLVASPTPSPPPVASIGSHRPTSTSTRPSLTPPAPVFLFLFWCPPASTDVDTTTPSRNGESSSRRRWCGQSSGGSRPARRSDGCSGKRDLRRYLQAVNGQDSRRPQPERRDELGRLEILEYAAEERRGVLFLLALVAPGVSVLAPRLERLLGDDRVAVDDNLGDREDCRCPCNLSREPGAELRRLSVRDDAARDCD